VASPTGAVSSLSSDLCSLQDFFATEESRILSERMTPEDIAALYEYLHSLAPVDGPVGEPTFKKVD
jgi:hypothetical protein